MKKLLKKLAILIYLLLFVAGCQSKPVETNINALVIENKAETQESKELGAGEGVALLIRATPHWMDDFTEEQRAEWPAEKIAAYNRRLTVGDIVAVRPIDWEWGKKEGPPNFVIVKLTDLTLSETMQYQDKLEDADPTKAYLKRRKWNIPSTTVNYIIGIGGTVTVTSTQTSFTEKTSLIDIKPKGADTLFTETKND